MFGINLSGRGFKTAQYSSVVRYSPVQCNAMQFVCKTVICKQSLTMVQQTLQRRAVQCSFIAVILSSQLQWTVLRSQFLVFQRAHQSPWDSAQPLKQPLQCSSHVKEMQCNHKGKDRAVSSSKLHKAVQCYHSTRGYVQSVPQGSPVLWTTSDSNVQVVPQGRTVTLMRRRRVTEAQKLQHTVGVS